MPALFAVRLEGRDHPVGKERVKTRNGAKPLQVASSPMQRRNPLCIGTRTMMPRLP